MDFLELLVNRPRVVEDSGLTSHLTGPIVATTQPIDVARRLPLSPEVGISKAPTGSELDLNSRTIPSLKKEDCSLKFKTKLQFRVQSSNSRNMLPIP